VPLLECVLLLSSAFLHVQSRVFVFITYFLRFTTLFVALSFVCSLHSSPHIHFPTHLYFIFLRHNLHCDSYHAIIVQADIESSVFVCIPLSLSCSSNSLNHDSSDLILNLNRYRQPICIDMITDRTARGHAIWKPTCVLYSSRCLLLRVGDDGREEEDRGSQCAHLAYRDKLDAM